MAIESNFFGRTANAYGAALVGEAALLLLFTAVARLGHPHSRVQDAEAAILCAAMGVQNSLVTRLSGAVVRTTHLTGVFTDIGIECVRAWEWLRRTAARQSGLPAVGHLLRLRRVPELRRLRLHLAILSSFLGGA